MKFDRDIVLSSGKTLFTPSGLNGVKWPSPEIQRAYTGADCDILLTRTVDFIEKLVSICPLIESESWRGLDFGVGFGRVASLLTLFGQPSQLTCVDAWEKSLDLARNCGLTNPSFVVEPIIQDSLFSSGTYDFVYAYSIFTHLPKDVFISNIEKLMLTLKPNGVLIFTVRELKFIEFLKRLNKYAPVVDQLETVGYWFGNAQSSHYGDTVVSTEWIQENLKRFGILDRLGSISSEPFQCLMTLRPYVEIN